jgi:bile acid-coenzyme A ligase
VRRTWPARIDELAAAHPDAEVLRAVGSAPLTLTWAALSRRSAGVTQLLAHHGVTAGSTVVVELPNGAAHVLATIAAWRLGATVLPCRPGLPAPERSRLLDLARPSLVVAPDGSPAGTVTVTQVLGAAPVEPETAEAPEADPAWLLASGGSTGTPKLIAPPITTAIGSAGMGFASGDRVSTALPDGANHRHPTYLVAGPLFHMQSFATLHRTLLDDYRIVVLERFEPEAVLDIVETENVALMMMVPTMLMRLLRSPTIGRRDLSSLERVFHGGAACPEWVTRGWIDLVGGERFILGYGMSEGIGTALISGDEWLEHPGSVGKPINCETLIVNENGDPVARGVTGEIYFRPNQREQVFRYVGNEPVRRLEGHYFSVGDLGWLDDDGYLYIADRRTDMIVTGGANVFTAEVEAVLLAHPFVEDAVVVGLSEPEWGQRVHAIVEQQPGAPRLDLATLQAHCRAQLVDFKVPRSLEIVDSIPRNEAGKVNRRALVDAREPGYRIA